MKLQIISERDFVRAVIDCLPPDVELVSEDEVHDQSYQSLHLSEMVAITLSVHSVLFGPIIPAILKAWKDKRPKSMELRTAFRTHRVDQADTITETDLKKTLETLQSTT